MNTKRIAVSVKKRAQRILALLKGEQPEGFVELHHHTPFQLLVATILSAQCTDERVNRVTPELFRQYPGPADLAKADLQQLETLIRPTGFFRSKAKNLMACGQRLVREFHACVPETMEELISLSGIGRKTANVILGTCFGQPALVVDTHVKRVANRLDFTTSADPARIEEHLKMLFPQEEWTGGSQRLLLHGRYVCVARKPKCGVCSIDEECGWKGKTGSC